MTRARPLQLIIWLVILIVLAIAGGAGAHNIYLMNDNHTDYGWNATTDVYEASMLSELDYYRARIDATAGNPSTEQARFNADCWYYLYLYQNNRSPEQFQDLINKIIDGHITVPLNPFVTLYGALPTEAAVRAGYYPGRIERQYPGVQFQLAQAMEDAAIPWGIASLWAGSQARYSWKGICGCTAPIAPYGDRTAEVFRWQGPDNQTMLMKWYALQDNQSWGGYAEARQTVTSATPNTAIADAIAHFSAPTNLPTGLFGAGWDDVNWQTTAFETVVHNWNAANPGGDQAILSNGVDYFHELEGDTGQLPTLRGGFGNDWALWPAALSARTAQTRNAIEQLRTTEALATVVHALNPSVWSVQQPLIEAGLVDYFKYMEHGWGDGGVGIDYVINNKKQWAQNFTAAVTNAQSAETAAFAALFQTPDEDRVVVFNPLVFARTDIADLPIAGSGPYVVQDVATNTEVANQVVTIGGANFLRILAANVPSFGYRVYRYAAGSPSNFPAAATIANNRIESDLYRVDVGARGELTSAFDKTNARELSGTGLNDFGGGIAGSPMAENVGPVSATLRVDVIGPPNRSVRVTLIQGVDRILIDDEILANVTTNSMYRYNINLTQPQIRFEEVGAIARPGLTDQGGDFLAGTRADFMTLNHFVSFNDGGYTVTLSNWDASFMQVGSSSVTAFDLSKPEISVLAVGNPSNSQITTQGGDANFRNRFALRGASGPSSAADAMQMSLAHQNPLQAIPLARNRTGPLTAASASWLSVSASNVLVTAVKPAEEGGRGIVVRAWELEGSATNVSIDASAFAPTSAAAVSLIETDLGAMALDGGVISDSIRANAMRAYRFVPAGLAVPTSTPSSAATFTPTPAISSTATPAAVTPTASASVTQPTGTPSAPTATLTFTSTVGLPVGDLNGDGHVTQADLALLIADLFDSTASAGADVNGDGAVTSADVSAIIRLLGTK